MTKMVVMPIYGKNKHKTIFETGWPMSLKLGIQNWELEYYQMCSNDDPRLNFDLFMQMSTLVLYVAVWENTYMVDYSETIENYDTEVTK